MKKNTPALTLIITLFIANLAISPSTLAAPQSLDNIDAAFDTLLSSYSHDDISQAIATIENGWQDRYIPQLLETVGLTQQTSSSRKLFALLSKKTGQKFGGNINDWYFWLWNKPEKLSPGYANFKANLYKRIDPAFETYFQQRQASARIRLDEIRWGGVRQDGIPPLRNPDMIAAKKAKYLDDDNVVFGIEVNGDARAYPKRILAWHEMFVDTIGGVEIAGVYCTLCGTIIPYKTSFNGVKHALGTSGFLYRSNKLMYDKATQSLWNTIKGEPVLGPLVDKGIALEYVSVVTTTWGEWKRRHPKTKVLSLETGHSRNYDEGAAYQNYFSTDRLMFNTPFQDERLKNKQEVLALRFAASPREQLAIDTAFLKKNPLYKNKIGQQKLLILTDKSGANRVYDPKEINFVSYDQDSTVTDNKGNKWQLTESELRLKNKKLFSLPYHRAFWFGWHATYPETRLITDK